MTIDQEFVDGGLKFGGVQVQAFGESRDCPLIGRFFLDRELEVAEGDGVQQDSDSSPGAQSVLDLGKNAVADLGFQGIRIEAEYLDSEASHRLELVFDPFHRAASIAVEDDQVHTVTLKRVPKHQVQFDRLVFSGHDHLVRRDNHAEMGQGRQCGRESPDKNQGQN